MKSFYNNSSARFKTVSIYRKIMGYNVELRLPNVFRREHIHCNVRIQRVHVFLYNLVLEVVETVGSVSRVDAVEKIEPLRVDLVSLIALVLHHLVFADLRWMPGIGHASCLDTIHDVIVFTTPSPEDIRHSVDSFELLLRHGECATKVIGVDESTKLVDAVSEVDWLVHALVRTVVVGEDHVDIVERVALETILDRLNVTHVHQLVLVERVHSVLIDDIDFVLGLLTLQDGMHVLKKVVEMAISVAEGDDDGNLVYSFAVWWSVETAI